MLKKMTIELMRTTAVLLLPIAAMAPAAALAAQGAEEVVACNDDGAVETGSVVSVKADGSCEATADAIVIAAADTSPALFKVAQATEAGDQDEEFSFDIAEEAASEPKPVYVNEVEIGFGWVSDDSAKFGEFSGLEEEGPFIIGNFNLQFRDPYDSGSTEYFIANGSNLGLESRSLYAEYGRQGQFTIFALFDSIPKFIHDDAMTPFIFRDGGTNLTLPANWVPSDRSVSGLTLLNASLEDFNVHHKREKAGGGLSWLPGKGWTAETSFFRETKQGTRTISAIFGSSGGNPAGMIVPEPIDYETDNFDASLAYNGKRGQFALSYNLSLFRDNNTALVFQNPFASTRWAPAASFPNGFGQLALPPDSHAHRITLAGKYLLTPKTRATAHITYSRMTQDDQFLPFTVNPGLSVTTPLPRDSLNGEINTVTANLGLSSQLTPKLTFRTAYRYENRDNDTPRDVFIVVPGDAADQGTLFDSTARINRPYSREQHLAEAEASYRLSGKSKVSVTYEYEQLERDFTEVEETREHRVKGKFQAYPTTRTSGWVGVEYAVRDGSEYIDNLPFLAGATPEHLGPDPEDEFENHPLLRKFYIADRDRLKIHGAANWTPHDDFNFAVFGRYNNDDYDDSVLGLTESSTLSFTGDLSYQPSPVINYHLFYTYDNIEYEQTGLSHNRFTPAAQFNDLTIRGWTADTEDQVHTTGAGFEWAAIKDKLDINVDYYYSNATTGFDFTAGTGLSFLPVPDLKTTLHNIEAIAEYQVTEQFWFKARYQFSDYNVADFSLDGIAPDAMNLVIGLGNQAPDFSVHVLGFSAVYKF